MKVLITAYACNPYQGSEPGIGWTLMSNIANRHDVYLITPEHSRAGLVKAEKEGIMPANVKIRYVGRYRLYSKNRLISHMESWISYSNFNNLVLKEAEKWHSEVRFDLCHQVTLASWRKPPSLWRIPIPFIWGPIGGAGHIPHSFRSMLSLSARIFEMSRDINTFITVRSKSFKKCMQHAKIIIAANEETEIFLRPYRSALPMFRLPSGSITSEKVERFARPPSHNNAKSSLTLFAGGSLEGRKGLSLALKALHGVAQEGIEFNYTIAGVGPELNSLKLLSERLGLSSMVTFHSGYQGSDYIQTLHKTDVYFLPSLRETTPATLLEAILAGCYPVVADASAQGEIVRMADGHAINADCEESMINGLIDAVIWCARNKDELGRASARTRSLIIDYFSSERHDSIIDHIYKLATDT